MDRHVGYAKRIRVRMPFAATRYAWDCRPFGLGRIVAPMIPTTIDLAEGVCLNLATGDIRAESALARRSA